MFEYIHDKEEKYLDELLVHLRAHNKSFTGEKKNETVYVYAVKNDELQGGLKATLSWDWVGLSNIYYETEDALHALLSKVKTLFDEDAAGYKCYTIDPKKHKDLCTLGFLNMGTVNVSPNRGTYYIADTKDFHTKQTGIHTISSKDIVMEYDKICKEKIKETEKSYIEEDPLETQLYIALDDKTFAGGIKLEIYSDSLYVDLLAVNKTYKGKRIGTKLMDIAEKVARDRNMVSMDVGTTEFQARPFYEKQGYKVIFTRQNFPKGYECYTLLKQLNDETGVNE